MATFQPHGLILTPIMEGLYLQAYIANIYDGIPDPKESKNAVLIQYILNKIIFTEGNFAGGSRWTPTPTSSSPCDYTIQYIESIYTDFRMLLLVQYNRPGSKRKVIRSEPFSLKALEEKAKDRCQLYLEYMHLKDKNSTFVYAATVAGAHIRLWVYKLGDLWVPLWGSNNPGDWGQYKDIGSDEAGLERHFYRIKQAAQNSHVDQDYGMPHLTNTLGLLSFQEDMSRSAKIGTESEGEEMEEDS
jgi:hypothetical protein